MVPSAVHTNSIVHSTVPVHVPVQQLETPFDGSGWLPHRCSVVTICSSMVV